MRKAVVMENNNIYEISKNWFYYVAENVNVKAHHTHLYFFIINKWNSLFWKQQFGLPTENTMECTNIRSYKTYIKTLTELEDFGFIKIIERAKNQNTSNVIEVVKNTEAMSEANTKAMLKATTQSDYQSGVQSIASIIKHINNKQYTIKHIYKLKESVDLFLKENLDEIVEEKIYRKFDHLKISFEEFEKLNEEYDKETIDSVLDNIQNYKNNKNYKSLYLTANNWLKKEPKKNQQNNNQSHEQPKMYGRMTEENVRKALIIGASVKIPGVNER